MMINPYCTGKNGETRKPTYEKWWPRISSWILSDLYPWPLLLFEWAFPMTANILSNVNGHFASMKTNHQQLNHTRKT